jgi:hypothetical protein
MSNSTVSLGDARSLRARKGVGRGRQDPEIVKDTKLRSAQTRHLQHHFLGVICARIFSARIDRDCRADRLQALVYCGLARSLHPVRSPCVAKNLALQNLITQPKIRVRFYY